MTTPPPNQLKAMQLEFNQAWMRIWKQLSHEDRKGADKSGHSFSHRVAWETWCEAKQASPITTKTNP